MQHSGIGDPSDFEYFGIQKMQNLPGVGKNLLEQSVLQIIYPILEKKYATLNSTFHSMFGFANTFRDLGVLNGPLSVDNGTIVGYFKSSPDLPNVDLGNKLKRKSSVKIFEKN